MSTGLGGEVIWLCPSLDDSPDDLSGNGNHGTYQNGLSTISNSEFGGSRAYNFDGSDDRITFNYIASMNQISAFSSFFWIYKLGGFSNYILNIGGSNNRSPWMNTYGNGRFETRLDLDNNTGDSIFYNDYGQGIYNQWDHIGLSWDGINANHYVNGNLVQTDVTSAGSTTENDYGSAFGLGLYGGGIYGYLDDIRIYNRGLSNSEVELLYSKRGYSPGTHVHRTLLGVG